MVLARLLGSGTPTLPPWRSDQEIDTVSFQATEASRGGNDYGSRKRPKGLCELSLDRVMQMA